jgi:hypothetical protein
MENSPRSLDSDTKEQDQQRRIAPAANQLHGKELPLDIGHVLVSGERSPGARPQPEIATSKEAIDLQRVASMNRSELINISEGINIDGTTLRHVYETHLIGENGLRRLVYEHMQGGNLQEALHHEVLEHQTDFERDPRLRHQFKPTDVAAKANNSQPGVSELLTYAGLTKLDTEKELTAPKLLPEHMAKRSHLQPRQRRLLDISFVVIILILLILVIMLAMSRT